MSYVQQQQAYSGRGTGPRAGFWKRLAAAIVDGIVIGVINFILVLAFKVVGDLIGVVVWFSYLTVLEGGPTGQTLGKRALGIRVIDAETGGPIGYGRAFVRAIGRYLSSIVILLGYFWMLWDKERQCWHDKLAGDYVVPVSAYPVS